MESPKKSMMDTCKYCNQPILLDTNNAATVHHRTCGIAFRAGQQAAYRECAEIAEIAENMPFPTEDAYYKPAQVAVAAAIRSRAGKE